MNLRLIALVAAVLGGLLWIVRWLTDGSALSDGLYWAGLVAVAVALAGAGAGLVRSSALPLRALVAVALPLLVWSVVAVLRPAGPAAVDGLLGLVAVAVGGVGRARSRPRGARRRAGAHAA
jgi:hypothetical protein